MLFLKGDKYTHEKKNEVRGSSQEMEETLRMILTPERLNISYYNH